MSQRNEDLDFCANKQNKLHSFTNNTQIEYFIHNKFHITYVKQL